MKTIVVLSVFCLSLGVANAQINKPRSTTPPTSQPTQRDVEQTTIKTQNNDAVLTREVSNTEIKLKKVEGNSTDQTVTLHFIFTNKKANANIRLYRTQAVDDEGDSYNAEGSYFDISPLFTDVPTKAYGYLKKIPSTVKLLKIVKIDYYKEGVGEVPIEFRDLTIDWK